METLLFGPLAEAIFGALFGLFGENLVQRPNLAILREKIQGAPPEKVALMRALLVPLRGKCSPF